MLVLFVEKKKVCLHSRTSRFFFIATALKTHGEERTRFHGLDACNGVVYPPLRRICAGASTGDGERRRCDDVDAADGKNPRKSLKGETQRRIVMRGVSEAIKQVCVSNTWRRGVGEERASKQKKKQ